MTDQIDPEYWNSLVNSTTAVFGTAAVIKNKDWLSLRQAADLQDELEDIYRSVKGNRKSDPTWPDARQLMISILSACLDKLEG